MDDSAVACAVFTACTASVSAVPTAVTAALWALATLCCAVCEALPTASTESACLPWIAVTASSLAVLIVCSALLTVCGQVEEIPTTSALASLAVLASRAASAADVLAADAELPASTLETAADPA